ncbi:MAG: FAD-dependent oxidoreductase [Candidatus Hydrogenedentota bacterium]
MTARALLWLPAMVLGLVSGMGAFAGAPIEMDASRAEAEGEWEHSTSQAYSIGDGYLHDGDANKGESSLRFTVTAPEEGTYELSFFYPSHENRAAEVPVEVTLPDDSTESITVDQRTGGDEGKLRLGRYELDADDTLRVTIANTGTSGHVAADGIRLNPIHIETHDVVIVGDTPGGIMAAIAVARSGHEVVLLSRYDHIGGLPANGLGRTDIATRGVGGGLFREFVERVYEHYVTTYGENSPQAADAGGGFLFEPHVAEQVFNEMVAEHPEITVRVMRQFDAEPQYVREDNGRIMEIRLLNRETGQDEWYAGDIFLDATYEGDLSAAAGVPYRLGREGRDEYDEPMAGVIYKQWGGPVGPHSTGLADNGIQAYNYRLSLTRDEDNQVPIEKPETYNRHEYVSFITDLEEDRIPVPNPDPEARGEMAFDGIGRITNMASVPNDKVDANNQHAAYISTNLPEENWPWPTASWDWRDQYMERLKHYIQGLVWFVQNDPELPEDFRERASEWGLSADEYTDNDHWPRQLYVREGRRIKGQYTFTAHDALAEEGSPRPPIHQSSVTASHYPIDSHSVRKREPDRYHLDGFMSFGTEPYTVPFEVIAPDAPLDNLLTPVAVSATHAGLGTLRMEPCWMALGQAAGKAAAISLADGVPVTDVSRDTLQDKLVEADAVLMYFRDVAPGDPHYAAVQYFGLRGLLEDWEADPDEPLSAETAEDWMEAVDAEADYEAEVTTRGEFLDALHEAVKQ